jgi:nitrate/TMAO reductase-like tetraheme cytochrome c subunit
MKQGLNTRSSVRACIGIIGLVLTVLAMGGARAQSGQAAPQADYQRSVYDPIHFKPAIDQATNAQCLACHAEVLKPSVRAESPAGVKAATAKAWYQQVPVYSGAQDTFHRRHLETPMAKELMQLRCTTCHQGHDPRDENPGSSATSQRVGGFTLRKVVVPEQTCLKCHGQMNHTVMGLPQPWAESKDMFQNNCLLCHVAIRTTRHQVNYLNAAAIEEAGKKSGDSCHGCHGGRAWYRIPFPYARNPWPGMAPEVPDWAKGRPTRSEARFLAEGASQGEKK